MSVFQESIINSLLHPDVLSQITLYINDHDLRIMKNKIDECNYFAECGYLNLLKLTYDNGCGITANGHLEILQWIVVEDIVWCQNICQYAAKNNHFNVLNYIHSANCACNNTYIDDAAEDGNLDVLRWAFEHKYTISHVTLFTAAETGQLRVLRWLHEIVGYELKEVLYTKAAISGHVDILQWLFENNCPCGYYAHVGIFDSNNPEAIEWLRNLL